MSTKSPEWRRTLDDLGIADAVERIGHLIIEETERLVAGKGGDYNDHSALAQELALTAAAEQLAIWASNFNDASARFHSMLEPSIRLLHDEGMCALQMLAEKEIRDVH